jgi:hypothetical protein
LGEHKGERETLRSPDAGKVGEAGATQSDGDEGSEVLKAWRDGVEGASVGDDVEKFDSTASIVLYLPILALYVGNMALDSFVPPAITLNRDKFDPARTVFHLW